MEKNAKKIEIAEGDIISWEGVSRVLAGEVERNEDGVLVVRTKDGTSMKIDDLRTSHSLRVLVKAQTK